MNRRPRPTPETYTQARELQEVYEDRHHLFIPLTAAAASSPRTRIELAAAGHDIHFITYSQPFRLTGREANIHFHEVRRLELPPLRTPTHDLALATRMAEVASSTR